MNQPASTPALSTIALAALKAAVSATCESILASSPDLLFDHADGFWAPIRDAVDAEVSAWIRRHNVAHSSGNRLPAELFQMVLAPLKLQDRLSVARVCTTWKIRSASCSIMPLAKLDSITAAEARRLNAQLKFLGSPRVQLSVLLNTSNNTFFPSATFVRKHLSRAVELDVIVHGNSPTHTESDTFLKLLSTATPLLHTLSVSFDCSSKLESFLISSPWFGGSAPSLRRCRFYKAAFYAPVFSFVRVVFFLVDENSRLEHLNAVLCQFPQLEELCIRCHDSLARSRSRLKSPPGLRCLWLEGRVARLLKYLDSRAVPSVIIRQTVTPELTRMRHLVREPVKILDIIPYEDQPDLVFRSLLVRITESPQRSRVLEIEIPVADELVNDLLFSHLTTLSLHDPHRLRDVELPSMPALTHLAVYVAGPLAALHDALQPWALPRLRRLELVFTCAPGTNHRDCPAADITKFITLNLQAENRSVGLAIRGAEVIEPSVAELSAHVASLDVESHVRVPNAAPVWVRAADFENVWNGEVTLRDAM